MILSSLDYVRYASMLCQILERGDGPLCCVQKADYLISQNIEEILLHAKSFQQSSRHSAHLTLNEMFFIEYKRSVKLVIIAYDMFENFKVNVKICKDITDTWISKICEQQLP